MPYLFICYPRCGTCRKAQQWLDAHEIAYTQRHIVEQPPTAQELEAWAERAGLPAARLFNTSGILYREQKLKEKLPSMTEQERFALLATNGMLVKRPLLVGPDVVLVGFREPVWSEALLHG